MLVFMRLSTTFAIPDEVALLYDFVNSLDLRRYVEQGVAHEPHDDLATPAQLARWLQTHRLGQPGARISRAEHREALELRAALRLFLASSPRERTAAAKALRGAAAGFPLVVVASRERQLDLFPSSRRAIGGLGAVLAELVRLADGGRLERLKPCQSDECQWVFFDRSKPGNRRWCSSDRCGNRAKTRAYRDRRREPAARLLRIQ